MRTKTKTAALIAQSQNTIAKTNKEGSNHSNPIVSPIVIPSKRKELRYSKMTNIAI